MLITCMGGNVRGMVKGWCHPRCRGGESGGKSKGEEKKEELESIVEWLCCLGKAGEVLLGEIFDLEFLLGDDGDCEGLLEKGHNDVLICKYVGRN